MCEGQTCRYGLKLALSETPDKRHVQNGDVRVNERKGGSSDFHASTCHLLFPMLLSGVMDSS